VLLCFCVRHDFYVIKFPYGNLKYVGGDINTAKWRITMKRTNVQFFHMTIVSALLCAVLVGTAAACAGSPASAPAPVPTAPGPAIEISTWDLRGKEGTTEWFATLAIEKITSNAFGSTFEGYFDWYYSGALLGREVFSGMYTSSSRKINIQGIKIENGRRIGGVSLGLGKYEAVLSADGNNLTRGAWDGGTWEAIRRSK